MLKKRGRSKKPNAVSKRKKWLNAYSGPSSEQLSTIPLRNLWYSHKYSDAGVSINPGLAGSPGVYIYSCNGLYDPNYTASGHQPLGFDQVKELYQAYYVIRSRLKVFFYNSDAGTPVIVGITIKNDTTALSDSNIYIEQPGTVWTVLTGNGKDNSCKTLSMTWDADKYSKWNVQGHDVFAGTSGTNPDLQWYFHIWVAALDASTDPNVTNFATELNYHAKWQGYANAPGS